MIDFFIEDLMIIPVVNLVVLYLFRLIYSVTVSIITKATIDMTTT